MKKLIALIVLFVGVGINAQDLTLIHINAKWNERNNYKYIDEIVGAKVSFGYLEDQPDDIKNSIKSVPTLILMKNGRPVYVWQADISFKIKTTMREIQDVINTHRFSERRRSTIVE